LPKLNVWIYRQTQHILPGKKLNSDQRRGDEEMMEVFLEEG
jgi:hypothetical protein